MASPSCPFKVVLTAVERKHSPDTLGDPTSARIQVELSRLFDLDGDTASNIVSAIPIVIVEGLDGRAAGVVRERLSKLSELGCKVVITDEPYEHIVFEPHEHIHFAALPGAFDRTITCNSLSKTYSITGWRLGYVQAAPQVIAQARKVHDFLTVGAAAPLQEAAVAGLELPDSYYAGLRALYTAKRDLFLGLVRQTGLSFTEPQGAYYVMLDISPLDFATDTEASEWLIREIGVAGVAGSSFFREPVHHLIRFHFAKNPATLQAAGERLLKLRAGRRR